MDHLARLLTRPALAVFLVCRRKVCMRKHRSQLQPPNQTIAMRCAYEFRFKRQLLLLLLLLSAYSIRFGPTGRARDRNWIYEVVAARLRHSSLPTNMTGLWNGYVCVFSYQKADRATLVATLFLVELENMSDWLCSRGSQTNRVSRLSHRASNFRKYVRWLPSLRSISYFPELLIASENSMFY